ncbi:MAG TPA: DNA alkylation repair protein [Cyclobacteriaceae bacterium]|nr:DNA alkylation repair protein [Cyclobacteriaceae bacterium]
MNPLHKEILGQIQHHSGKPTQHTFLNSYLGNSHPRYPISIPILRKIAKEWMMDHRELATSTFATLLSSLLKGKSSTEKCMVGILLDYATPEQRKFDPKLFNTWLNYLEGWAEVDSLCTGRYSDTEILRQWNIWNPQLIQFSKSKNIHKRRASLVLLCSPLRKSEDTRLAGLALRNTSRLKAEKEILITKAISWVLRNMVKHNRSAVQKYLKEESDLPAIAVRETRRVLETGRKTSGKKI